MAIFSPNEEQMRNLLGVEHQPDRHGCFGQIAKQLIFYFMYFLSTNPDIHCMCSSYLHIYPSNYPVL